MVEKVNREKQLIKLLTQKYSSFLHTYSLDKDTLKLDPVVLLDICVRYYKDVDRLHIYHKIERIDTYKIAGYITYWVTKLRPINVYDVQRYKEKAKLYGYINELFAMHISFARIVPVHDFKDLCINDNFLDSFCYLLRYRQTTGDNLAMMYRLMCELGNELKPI